MSLNVLMTAGSRRVPLLEAFRRALRDLRLAGSVQVTDVNPLSPTVLVADKAHLVPLSSDPEVRQPHDRHLRGRAHRPAGADHRR